MPDHAARLAARPTWSPFLWLTCGNTSQARQQEIFAGNLRIALEVIRSGEPLVELS